MLKGQNTDFDSMIVETLVDSLDAHARGYLEKVNEEAVIPEYTDRVRKIGTALFVNAEQRSHLRDPYSEERLRELASTSGRLIMRRYRMSPEEYESELEDETERCRAASRDKAVKWHAWKCQISDRILSRFEACYRRWYAEAVDRTSQAAGPPEASQKQ